MANTKPTHEDWERARQLRNEAATRYIWRTKGITPNAPAAPHDPDADKYLEQFYSWDAEMDRIGDALKADEAAAE